jgi:hypothetical protein
MCVPHQAADPVENDRILRVNRSFSRLSEAQSGGLNPSLATGTLPSARQYRGDTQPGSVLPSENEAAPDLK